MEGRGKLALAALCSGMLAAVAAAEPSTQQREAGENRRLFEFHSQCALNLHHFLYWKAHPHSRAGGRVADWPPTLDPAERRAVEDAVDYYREAFKEQDLLFSDRLSRIKARLVRHDGGASFAGLGLERRHAAVLEQAQTVYRWHLWPAHQAANRRWIEQAAGEVKRWGEPIVERLEAIYGDPFPRTPIRLDVVVEGHWAGAYTTVEPVHIVVASSRGAYQGKAALEMVFHEASHGILGPRRGTAIDKLNGAFGELGQSPPRDLWHALLFYTTGSVARELYRREGLGAYRPYAYANGLYERAWSAFLPALEIDWQAYLDGETTMDGAVAAMATRLSSSPPPPGS